MDDAKHVFFKIVVVNYNNMAYIKRCLDSIMCQVFTDFAAVIVDDLSTDFSDRLAQSYARKFPSKVFFVRLPDKRYAGGARNAGISFSRIESQYTWFVDSDDCLASNDVLMNIYKNIIANRYPDIVRCSYIDEHLHTRSFVKLSSNIDSILIDGAAPFKTCIRSAFTQKFVEGRARNNDVVWFMKLMDNVDCRKISAVKSPCYVYNRRSITSCQNNLKMQLDENCVYADRMLVKDLSSMKFNHANVEQRRLRVLQTYSRKYKPEITVDDMLKHSIVISIDKDRYVAMCKLFKQHGFSIMPQMMFGSTFKDKSGPYNCKHSHMRAVQYAKDHNWPYVMMFEDDAYPCDDVIDKMRKYLYAIPGDAQLVVLGWSNDYMQDFSKPFNRITMPTISGSHSYILFNESYDKFIEYHMIFPEKSADNTVFMKMSPSYVINWPMFIQYTSDKSMNGHVGFAFYGNRKTAPYGFSLETLNATTA